MYDCPLLTVEGLSPQPDVGRTTSTLLARKRGDMDGNFGKQGALQQPRAAPQLAVIISHAKYSPYLLSRFAPLRPGAGTVIGT